MAKPAECDQYIWDFICAVWPDTPELIVATFNERAALEGATEVLTALRARVTELEETLEEDHQVTRQASEAAEAYRKHAERLEAALRETGQVYPDGKPCWCGDEWAEQHGTFNRWGALNWPVHDQECKRNRALLAESERDDHLEIYSEPMDQETARLMKHTTERRWREKGVKE